MVRLALQDWGIARVGRRAAILCACAFCGLAAQPALAMPGHDAQGELLSAELLVDRGPGQHLGHMELEGSAGLRAPLTANTGTFDIAAPSGQSLVPPGAASTAAVERLLVTNDAPPAADSAFVQGGAIVLASAAKTAAATTQATATNNVNFKGTTTGCFGSGCTPSASATIGGLTFTGGSFDLSSSGTGFLAISGTQNNLGTVSLSGTSFNYSGTPFSLLVTFSSPGAVSGTFGLNLIGSVSGENSGGVFFNFANPTQSFTVPNGTLSLTVLNTAISGSASNLALSGFINANVQPPPTPDVPRDEVVLSLETTPPPPSTDSDNVLDLSQLTPTDVAAPIDSGVTSGADPSEWSPIAVDEDKRPGTCLDGAPPSEPGGPAICHAEKK